MMQTAWLKVAADPLDDKARVRDISVTVRIDGPEEAKLVGQLLAEAMKVIESHLK